MTNPTGEAQDGILLLDFDRRVMLQFRGSVVTLDADLLKRPVGRPPHHVQRLNRSFYYNAASRSRARRVVAKVEWHLGELFPRVGFIVTNMGSPSKRAVVFYNKRGTAERLD